LQDLGSNAFFAYEQTNSLAGKKLPPPVTPEYIADISKGNLPKVKVADIRIGGADDQKSKDQKPAKK